MKILYVGAESANWVVALCNEFCKQGHEVTCVVQQLDEYDKENSLEGHENMTRINMSFQDIQNPQKVKSRLVRELTQNKPDVILGSHAPISPVVKELAQHARVPWGVMILDIPSDLMERQRWRMLQWEYWFNILKHAPILIFNTKIARDEFERYTGQRLPDKNVIPYGTELIEEFYKSGLEEDENYVLSICRLASTKNCIEIPKALGYLENPPTYVAVGRDSGELDKIRRCCENFGVEFKHFEKVTQKEKFELIQKASAVIYPQSTEYIGGLSPWEAMYVGTPVLCRDYKVLKDLYYRFPYYYDDSGDEYTVGNYEYNLAEQLSYVLSRNKKRTKYKLIDGADFASSEANFEIMARRMLGVIGEFVK